MLCHVILDHVIFYNIMLCYSVFFRFKCPALICFRLFSYIMIGYALLIFVMLSCPSFMLSCSVLLYHTALCYFISRIMPSYVMLYYFALHNFIYDKNFDDVL